MLHFGMNKDEKDQQQPVEEKDIQPKIQSKLTGRNHAIYTSCFYAKSQPIRFIGTNNIYKYYFIY